MAGAFATAGLGVLFVVVVGGTFWVLRRGTRDVVAFRADHPLAAIDVPVAEVGTVAMAEVTAAPTLPHVP